MSKASLGLSNIVFLPSIIISPSSGLCTPANVLIRVDFPAPLSPQSAKTELWNGSSWTEIADLATARTGTGGAGVATSAIAIGGNPGSPPYALAEAFTAALTNKTITAS